MTALPPAIEGSYATDLIQSMAKIKLGSSSLVYLINACKMEKMKENLSVLSLKKKAVFSSQSHNTAKGEDYVGM